MTSLVSHALAEPESGKTATRPGKPSMERNASNMRAKPKSTARPHTMAVFPPVRPFPICAMHIAKSRRLGESILARVAEDRSQSARRVDPPVRKSE